MSRKRKGMTLAEHDAQLRGEGRYDEVMGRLDRKRADVALAAAEWRRAELPLVEELQAAGFDVKSVWDLVNSANDYVVAIPILMRHLERPYPSRIREGSRVLSP